MRAVGGLSRFPNWTVADTPMPVLSEPSNVA